MNKVICMRLNSGEEIIGKIADPAVLTGAASQFDLAEPWEPTGKVTLYDVRGITFQPLPNDQFEIGFFPFVVGNPDAKLTFVLDNSAYAVYSAQPNIEKGYIQQTPEVELTAVKRPGTKI